MIISDEDHRKDIILIVDDNPACLKVASHFFNHYGYKVIESNNGIDGIKKAKQKRPHLILMDIRIPGMNGINAMKKIRKNHILDNTPIIAMTSYAMKGDRESILSEGFDDYYAKPLTCKKIKNIIKDYLKEVPKGQ